MLTGAFADRGKPIFAVGVPLAPAPNRAVDLDGDGVAATTGGGEAAAANANGANAAADAAAPLLSDRLLTMRAAFMERINRHMGAAAAEVEDDDEDEDMGEEGGGGGSKQQKKKKKDGGGRAKAR